MSTVELDDVQGVVRSGYGRRNASFLLLRVADPAAARRWLADVSVTSARDADARPARALHVGFTSEGLGALGLPPDVAAQFSTEFVEGMAGDDARARRLGDVGANDPGGWAWGTGTRVPHVALFLYADAHVLPRWQSDVEAECLAAGFVRLAELSTADAQELEPFGFRDGISQPLLDWERARPLGDHDRLTYEDRTCLGEFVLGYPNEYGLYTPRPLLDPARDAHGWLLRAEEAPELADLGRNGAYLVVRQLQQDVDGFWAAVDRLANGDAAEREPLAAAMVGRTKHGDALVDGSDPGSNGFTYESDPRGLRCPLGAHIRRANPRTPDLPPGAPGLLARACRALGFAASVRKQDLVASARFHRLLRRGRKYEAGIHFVCVVGNIKRQFEFVQSAWMMGSKFAGLDGESDPLLGNRAATLDAAPTNGFSLPQVDGPDRRLAGLPQFVTVRGGAYFFLPGIRAVRYLAGAPRKEA
jgi:deferrochelatase/peroxidase EfeB